MNTTYNLRNKVIATVDIRRDVTLTRNGLPLASGRILAMGGGRMQVKTTSGYISKAIADELCDAVASAFGLD